MKFKKINLFNITPFSIASKKDNSEIVRFLSSLIRNNPNYGKRIYLNIPNDEENLARSKGALFDQEMKKWYFTNPKDLIKFDKWIMKSGMVYENLSDEQQALVNLAKEGKNVLVDACIGSGKTSTIQVLCDELPEKKILYLTYNRLLKIDAKSKIQSKNAFVTNYHGFAFSMLNKNNIGIGGVSDLIQIFLANIERIKIDHYDLLLIDEYQDIDKEISQMLEFIKKENPFIQVIAVGDYRQKIYDHTTLDICEFITLFLEKHETLSFTTCFRLNAKFAGRLGSIWKKKIIGVNNECRVENMKFYQIEAFLANQDPSDILCLGKRTGSMSVLLNNLESHFPDKFNKETVYASIVDEDRSHRIMSDNNVAIFTTFDSSKGLERKICVIFDFTVKYWNSRANQSDTRYEILRNIFCVAASRGKSFIIFVEEAGNPLLSDDIIAAPFRDNDLPRTYLMSEMFYFKLKDNVEDTFKLLKIEKDPTAIINEIYVKRIDGMIDLSPCVGILQEASFFNHYNIDDDIEFFIKNKKTKLKLAQNANLESKVLYYVSLQTKQDRYMTQISIPFVGDDLLRIIHQRMSEIFTRDEEVQVHCRFPFFNDSLEQECVGFCDVLKDDTVWELKFTSELCHEHYLQCAIYMIALSKPKGVLWNVRTNERMFITIPDREQFMLSAIKTITKEKAFNIEFYIRP